MDIKEWIEEHNEEALIADGFDEAIIGMCERYGNDSIVAYDKDRCIELLMKQFGKSDEDEEDIDLREQAEEYFSYNVSGSYMGENTPVFITFYHASE